MDDLVRRLRLGADYAYDTEPMHEAADRIEVLTAELAAAKRDLAEAHEALDLSECEHGLTANGNMWRYWAKLARESEKNGRKARDEAVGAAVEACAAIADANDLALPFNDAGDRAARRIAEAIRALFPAALTAHRDAIAAAEARGRVAGLQEAAGIVVHPPLKVQRSFSEALRDQIMPAQAPITPAEAARASEIAALIGVVRVQANLLMCGACYERGKTIGRRLDAALRALAGDQP